jgi:hypothetical protein
LENGKFGICDSDFNIIVPAKYTQTSTYENGICLVGIEENGLYKWNFIDLNGKELFKKDLTSIPLDFDNNYFIVGGNGGDGMIDSNGNVLVPFKYCRINSFQEGLSTVACSYWKWGAINLNGDNIIPCIYDDIGCHFIQGINWVKEGGLCGLIDTSGKLITPLIYDAIGEESYADLPIYKNIMPAKKTGKWGYINTDGQIIIPFIYDFATQFKNDYAVVEKDSLYGIINMKGNLIVPPKYKYIDIMSDSIYPATLNKKFGFINSKNQIIIPFEYDYADKFSEGLAFVCKDGKCGFIDYQNKTQIPFLFDKPEWLGFTSFSDGLCWLQYDGVWCYVDERGKIYKK